MQQQRGETDLRPPVADHPAKRGRKLRSAWVSFVGRIVAQVVGAVATVALAITILQPGPQPAASAARDAAAPAIDAARRVGTAGRPAVAVLPLKTLADRAGREYIADSLRSLIIAKLAESDAMAVVSATSSARFAGQSVAANEIADALGVQQLIEGTVSIVGDRVRVDARLVNAMADEVVWAATYEEPLADVLSLEARLAAAIADKVRGTVGDAVPARSPHGSRAAPTFATTVTLEP